LEDNVGDHVDDWKALYSSRTVREDLGFGKTYLNCSQWVHKEGRRRGGSYALFFGGGEESGTRGGNLKRTRGGEGTLGPNIKRQGNQPNRGRPFYGILEILPFGSDTLEKD